MADPTSGEIKDGDPPEIRDIAMILFDLPDAQDDASKKLNEVIAAVMDTKKAGSITITLNVGIGKLDDTTIEITPDVKSKVPVHPLKGRVFFPDASNNPTKDDPSQLWRGEDIRSAPTFRAEDEPIKGAPTT